MNRKNCATCENKKDKKYCLACAVAHNAYNRLCPVLTGHHLDEFEMLVGGFETMLGRVYEMGFIDGLVGREEMRELWRRNLEYGGQGDKNAGQ